MTEPNATGGSHEAWSKLADQFSQIAQQFRQHYERVATDNPPAEDPATQGSVERAVNKAGKAIEDTARTIGQSVRDPKVREDTGQAGSTLLRAVGATLAELGTALQREAGPKKPGDPPADPPAADPAPPKLDSAPPADHDTPPPTA